MLCSRKSFVFLNLGTRDNPYFTSISTETPRVSQIFHKSLTNCETMLCVQNSSRTLVEIQVCKQGRVVLREAINLSQPLTQATHIKQHGSPLPHSTALSTDVAFSSSPAFSIPISQCYQKLKNNVCICPAIKIRTDSFSACGAHFKQVS